jgi:exodeoxyribonuclease III
VRLPHVLDWLALREQENEPIDCLGLQELKMVDEKFPQQAFADAGYEAAWFGQKTYNGVALIWRKGLGMRAHTVQKNNPHFEDSHSRLIAMECGDVCIVNGYFPNGQAPGSDKFAYKMQWLSGLSTWIKQLHANKRIILLGDFNITFDDADVFDPDGMREQIHCTTQEREHLQDLCSIGLVDTFRLFPQEAKSYTWWDYRQGAFRRNAGLRIDHILADKRLQSQLRNCLIDKRPRRWEQASDHTPLVLELDLPEA